MNSVCSSRNRDTSRSPRRRGVARQRTKTGAKPDQAATLQEVSDDGEKNGEQPNQERQLLDAAEASATNTLAAGQKALLASQA